MSLNASLKAAVDCLSIADVTLRDVRAFLGDDFDPETLPDNPDLMLQTIRPLCKSISQFDGLDEDAGRRRVVFEMFAGVRVLNVSKESFSKLKPEDLSALVCATVECTFLLKYDVSNEAMAGELSDTALEEFSKHNVPFNMWPYWREIVHSACGRMGLPRVVMPTYRLSRAATHGP